MSISTNNNKLVYTVTYRAKPATLLHVKTAQGGGQVIRIRPK